MYSSSSISLSSHDASQDQTNNRIRRVDIATKATTTLAGSGSGGFLDGPGAIARFNSPLGVAIDPSGTFTLVAVRRPPRTPTSRHPAETAHLPRIRRIGRTGFHHTLRGQASGLALPQRFIP